MPDITDTDPIEADWAMLRGHPSVPSKPKEKRPRQRASDPSTKLRKALIRRYRSANSLVLPVNPAIDVTKHGAAAFVFGSRLADGLLGQPWKQVKSVLEPLGFRAIPYHVALYARGGTILEFMSDGGRLVDLGIVLPGTDRSVGLRRGRITVTPLTPGGEFTRTYLRLVRLFTR
jgi:hypothetical protein